MVNLKKEQIAKAAEFLTRHVGPWQRTLSAPGEHLRTSIHTAVEKKALDIARVKAIVDRIKDIKTGDPNARISPIIGAANKIAAEKNGHTAVGHLEEQLRDFGRRPNESTKPAKATVTPAGVRVKVKKRIGFRPGWFAAGLGLAAVIAVPIVTSKLIGPGGKTEFKQFNAAGQAPKVLPKKAAAPKPFIPVHGFELPLAESTSANPLAPSGEAHIQQVVMTPFFEVARMPGITLREKMEAYGKLKTTKTTGIAFPMRKRNLTAAQIAENEKGEYTKGGSTFEYVSIPEDEPITSEMLGEMASENLAEARKHAKIGYVEGAAASFVSAINFGQRLSDEDMELARKVMKSRGLSPSSVSTLRRALDKWHPKLVEGTNGHESSE